MIKHIYTVFIGILLAASIGVGVAAFYPAPAFPEYPRSIVAPSKDQEEPSVKELQQQREYDKQLQEYQVKSEEYNRNASLILVGSALVLLVFSLLLLNKINPIGDGIMLGGVITLIYGIIRSFSSGEMKLIFAMTVFGLVVSLILGYFKFMKPVEAAEATPKKRK